MMCLFGKMSKVISHHECDTGLLQYANQKCGAGYTKAL